jgi:hypothetical protein
MGCCLTKDPLRVPLVAPDEDSLVIPLSMPPDESADLLEVQFNELCIKGDTGDVIPTSTLARSMGISSITMGRLVTKWGYQVGRRYVDGSRLRVVFGLVLK